MRNRLAVVGLRSRYKRSQIPSDHTKKDAMASFLLVPSHHMTSVFLARIWCANYAFGYETLMNLLQLYAAFVPHTT